MDSLTQLIFCGGTLTVFIALVTRNATWLRDSEVRDRADYAQGLREPKPGEQYQQYLEKGLACLERLFGSRSLLQVRGPVVCAFVSLLYSVLLFWAAWLLGGEGAIGVAGLPQSAVMKSVALFVVVVLGLSSFRFFSWFLVVAYPERAGTAMRAGVQRALRACVTFLLAWLGGFVGAFIVAWSGRLGGMRDGIGAGVAGVVLALSAVAAGLACKSGDVARGNGLRFSGEVTVGCAVAMLATSVLAFAQMSTGAFGFLYALTFFVGVALAPRSDGRLIAVGVVSSLPFAFLAGGQGDYSYALFYSVIPLVNGLFDWCSWCITRHLIGHLARRISVSRVMFGALLDLLAAVVLLVLLSVVLGFLAQLWVDVHSGRSELSNAALGQLLSDVASAPWGPPNLWLTCTLVSTLVPTAIHAVVLVGTALTITLPKGVRHWLADQLEPEDGQLRMRYLDLVALVVVTKWFVAGGIVLLISISVFLLAFSSSLPVAELLVFFAEWGRGLAR
ncbi:MAG: hypothetical protein AAF533_11220 [Acidobacteriota bacterium]